MELVVKRLEKLTAGGLYEISKFGVFVLVVEQNCPYRGIDDKDGQVLCVYLKGENGIRAYLRVIKKRVVFDEVSIGRVIATKRQCDMGSRILAEGIRVIKNQLRTGVIKIEAQMYAKELYEK